MSLVTVMIKGDDTVYKSLESSMGGRGMRKCAMPYLLNFRL